MIVKKAELKEHFKALGITKGDILLVHSSILDFGRVEKFSKEAQLFCFYDAIMETITDEGTLLVPAFFYEYGKFAMPFDTKKSPVSKSLGVFSAFVASLQNAYRSPHPIMSLAAVGKKAKEITQSKNPFCFGVDSPWQKLHAQNAKILMLGTAKGMTFSHYIEHMIGVPYRYIKIFNTPVYENNKLLFSSTYSSARYLDFDINVNLSMIEKRENELLEAKVLKMSKYNGAKIRVVECSKIFDYIKDRVFENQWYLLVNKPKFKLGQIPLDGVQLAGGTGFNPFDENGGGCK